MTIKTTIPPLEFIDKMHDWIHELCDDGDGMFSDGHKKLAQKAWKYFMESDYYVKN